MGFKGIDTKSITTILRSFRKQKANSISAPKLKDIHYILLDKSRTKYVFEILALYNYAANYDDKKAFIDFDQVIFPANSQSDVFAFEVPLQLAYMRLQCLLKFNLPYEGWVETTRQIMHESYITSTDIKNLLSLSFFMLIKLNSNLLRFYLQFLNQLSNCLETVDIVSLMIFRKFLSKQKYETGISKKIKECIEDILTQNTKFLSVRQLYLLMTCNVINRNWVFKAVFKGKIMGIKRFGFFIDMLNRPSPWRKWAFSNYSKQQILNKLPQYIQPEPCAIIENIQSKFWINKPYCDQFFEFNQYNDPKLGRRRWQLHNYHSLIYNYIENAYTVFSSGGNHVEQEYLDKIEDVLEDILDANYQLRSDVFMYLALSFSVSYYKYSKNRLKKIQKQNEILKRAYKILTEKKPQKQLMRGRQKRVIVTRILRSFAILEIQSIRTLQFKFLYQMLKSRPHDIESILKFNSTSGQITELEQAINNYITGQKANDPIILYAQFKKIQLEDKTQGLEFYYASNAEFDRCLTVDCFLKMKNKKKNKQVNVLIDFAKKKDWIDEYHPKKQYVTSTRRYWKEKYISQWYDMNFQAVPQNSINQYISNKKYEKYFQSD